MFGDRTRCLALCLLAAPLRDAYAAGVVSHHLAAKAARHGQRLSLLQLGQSHASVHTQGVTPDFFEDPGPSAVHSFEPAVSGHTMAAVQEVVQQPRAGPATQPQALAAAAAETRASSGSRSSLQLLPKEQDGPSMFTSQKMTEAASEASRIFSLVAEGARAAARNVVPSWFEADDASVAAAAPPPPQPAEKAAAGPVIVDASRGHKRTEAARPVAAAQLGHAETRRAATATAAAASSHEQQPAPSLGAMSFFGSALRHGEGESPAAPATPVAMIATGPKTVVDRDEDAVEVLAAPHRTQAEVQASSRRAEEMRASEAREAAELARQNDLESRMDSIRLDYPR